MTEYGGSTRLPRYDWNTLQPIRNPLLNNDGVVLSGYRSYSRRPIPLDLYTVPRVSQQWPRPLSPLAVDNTLVPVNQNQALVPMQDPNGTIRTIKTPYSQPMEENPLPVVNVNDGVQTTSVQKFDWEERLFENYHIGIHRLIFIIRKFPSLVALIITIWVLFGRNQSANYFSLGDGASTNSTFILDQQEKNQNISVFVTAVVALIGVVFGIRNHGNQNKSAVSQIISRLGSLTLSVVGEITSFVLGLIAIINLAKQTESTTPDCFPKTCFSLNNRIVQSGIQLGLTLLSFILTMVAIFHGIKAIIGILYDRRVARRTQRRKQELASYSNPLVTKGDIYY